MNSESELSITVMDEDTVTDDLVGECTVFLDLIKQKQKVQEWYKLEYKGREAGQIK